MATHYWIGSDGNFATPANWDPAGPPGAADDAILKGTHHGNITGSDQSGTQLDLLRTDPENTSKIGADGSPLIIDAKQVRHEGHGSLWLKSDDGGTTNFTELVIVKSPNMERAATFDGESVVDITVLMGKVYLAATLGTVAITNLVTIGHASSRSNDARLVIPQKSGAPTTAIVTQAHQYAGTVESEGVVTTVRINGGRWFQTVEEIGTLYMTGGICYYGSESTLGPITIAYIYGGILDLTYETALRKTVTTCYLFPGGTIRYDPALVTFTNPIIDYGGKLEAVTGAQPRILATGFGGGRVVP